MLRLCEGVRSGGRVSVLWEGLELSASYEKEGSEQGGSASTHRLLEINLGVTRCYPS